jgi:hypothetical protein
MLEILQACSGLPPQDFSRRALLASEAVKRLFSVFLGRSALLDTLFPALAQATRHPCKRKLSPFPVP